MNKFITLLILCLSFLTASGTETSRPRLLLTLFSYTHLTLPTIYSV
mgnify:CR=1 FL=1